MTQGKLQTLISTIIIYLVSISAIVLLVHASHQISMSVQAKESAQRTTPPSKSEVSFVHKSGIPTRIVVPERSIDVAVEEGAYDKSTRTWTESKTSALFASLSSPVNNQKGATFIYGHGTDAVFGRLGSNPPPIGTIAYVHTDTNEVYEYTLYEIRNYRPEDTSMFKNLSTGTPRLVLQTCTGIYSEWRTVFVFSFQKVSAVEPA